MVLRGTQGDNEEAVACIKNFQILIKIHLSVKD